MTVAVILIAIFIFYLGTMFGFFLRWWLTHRNNCSGTIRVIKTHGKTLYSLELEDYPEKIEFKKKVIFKVETSEVE